MDVSIKKDFARLTLLAVCGLFVLPLIALWFSGHAEDHYSQQLRAAFDAQIDADTQASPADRAQAHEALKSFSMVEFCDGDSTDLAAMRSEVCAVTGAVGQMHWMRKAAWFTLALGLFTLILVGVLSALAYAYPRRQIAAFVTGWWSMRVLSALEIIIQGTMLVWLSFWLTAYFFEVYFFKLILIAAVLAGGAVLAALRAVFRRAPMDNRISGICVDAQRAPVLWSHVRNQAAKLQTDPPAQIIAGIDNNFFVTETPVQLAEGSVSGRTLFVSLPLLRALDREEADAVLAHELAHFSSGDTKASAALGPKLNAYAHYMEALGESGFAIIAYFVLSLFRAAFELARSRDSRAREFAADAAAARLTSAEAISRALIKISGYSCFRENVEQNLFSQESRHDGPLRMADRIEQGLSAFTQSDQFRTAMVAGDVPHPFDSHPPLQQRMQNVGAVIPSEQFASLVTEQPRRSWVDFIADAATIEQQLWQQFEAEFANAHEQSLAFRLVPETEEERQIVLKYFPDATFALKKAQSVRISVDGIFAADEQFEWDGVASMDYAEGAFGTADKLTITHPEKTAQRPRTSSVVKLAFAGKDRDAFKAALERFYGRHQLMRRFRSEVAEKGGDAAG
jgi:Zn-dependent protease with chaperone function